VGQFLISTPKLVDFFHGDTNLAAANTVYRVSLNRQNLLNDPKLSQKLVDDVRRATCIGNAAVGRTSASQTERISCKWFPLRRVATTSARRAALSCAVSCLLECVADDWARTGTLSDGGGTSEGWLES